MIVGVIGIIEMRVGMKVTIGTKMMISHVRSR